uniref:DDB1- and CUL4-associated factor 10 n=1 Tax=Eptatretus burgeri TaxID=7764 RepID=A0A8C4PYZ1_EPTBU
MVCCINLPLNGTSGPRPCQLNVRHTIMELPEYFTVGTRHSVQGALQPCHHTCTHPFIENMGTDDSSDHITLLYFSAVHYLCSLHHCTCKWALPGVMWHSSVLAAACEQSQVLLIDPRCCRLVHTVPYAHEDCVNNIRFLDGRLFASCSDDATVALWDQRRLTCPVSRLRGHTSWVKNIEFEPLDGLLVTSGFDGNVLVWETNSCTEEGCPHRTFFHTHSLMRMRLTPDCSSMLISTSPGYLLVLYNLDLSQASIHGKFQTYVNCFVGLPLVVKAAQVCVLYIY